LAKLPRIAKPVIKELPKPVITSRTRKLNPDILEVGYIGAEFGKKVERAT
jgi:hypothetical protein